MSTFNTHARKYHHGDLAAAAVEAGLAMLKERAMDDLGLREVARAVGVSATALYRHFPDKDALLAALAGEGMARLGAAQATAQRRAGSGVAGFNATGRAYIDFALANPGLFRLMFSCRPGAAASGAEAPGMATQAPPMVLLRENVAALLKQEVDSEAVTILCLRSWGLVHGLAVLLLDRKLAPADHLIDAAIDVRQLLP